VPPQGHALPGALASPDIAVCGPLARSAEDLALALGVLAGPEPLDAGGWRLDLPAPERNSLSEYRVAIWPTDEMCPVDDEVAGRAEELGEMLRKQGATVSTTARPDIDLKAGHRMYLELLNGVMGASLKDNQRLGLEAAAAASDPNDLSNETVAMRAMVISHADWLSADNRREKLRYAWQTFFGDWDIVICPQTATPAFLHDHRPFPERILDVNGTDQNYMDQLFWAGIATASYLPSTVFPTGPSSAGLPIGLQAIGGAYQDYVTIDFARLVADEIGGFVPPPAFA
jgi:amidase